MKKFVFYTLFEKLISYSNSYENALKSLGLIDEVVVKYVEESIHA